MGFFDKYFNKKAVQKNDNSLMLPPPMTQTQRSYQVFGYGSGSLYSLLKVLMPGSSRDWRGVAGDLTLNGIVAVCLDWLIRNYNQARPRVYRKVGNQIELIEEHPVYELLENPQIDTTPSQFWSNVITDLKLNGNAYARKVRLEGKIGTLQWLPADSMVSVGNGKQFLTHYLYSTNSSEVKIELEDLIIWKVGRNPDDLRLGRSPLSAGLKEIATDNQISSTAYAVMANGPYPSMIVAPDASNNNVEVNSEDARIVKKHLETSFSGDNASGVVVMTSPMSINKVSMSPSELAFDEVRNAPILRICALMGLNPLTLGLTLDSATYSNLKTATQSCWQDGLIPLLDLLAEGFNVYLMPEYESDKSIFIKYDLSDVRELMDDKQAEADRAVKLYTSGICSLADAKRISGLEVVSGDESTYYNAPGASDLAILSLKSTKEEETYVPTEKMAQNARRGLEMREEFGRGGTLVGVARANQLIDRENLSEETVKRMFSFFSRHEGDRDAEGFREGEEGYPSAGLIAHLLWGGDEGYTWSRNIVAKLKEEEND